MVCTYVSMYAFMYVCTYYVNMILEHQMDPCMYVCNSTGSAIMGDSVGATDNEEFVMGENEIGALVGLIQSMYIKKNTGVCTVCTVRSILRMTTCIHIT